MPYGQQSISETLTLVARTEPNSAQFVGAIRQRASQVDTQVPVSSVQHLDALVADSIGRPRLYAGLLTVFAGLALVLALSGTYGLSAAIVSTRRREMSLRVCLGATPGRVMGLVLGESMGCVLAGTVMGLAGALLLARAMGGMFVGVDAFEGSPYLVSSVLLLGTGVLANLPAVKRAMTMNTATALSETERVRA